MQLLLSPLNFLFVMLNKKIEKREARGRRGERGRGGGEERR